jgi:hypothetical protein
MSDDRRSDNRDSTVHATFWWEDPEGKYNLEDQRDRMGNSKSDLREIWSEDVEQIKLTGDMVRCQATGNTVINLPVP